eukprot:1143202-Pelagomonas_calceolata.AAC.11
MSGDEFPKKEGAQCGKGQLVAECSSCEVTFQEEKSSASHQQIIAARLLNQKKQGRLAGALGQSSSITTLQRTGQMAALQLHTPFTPVLIRRLFLKLSASTKKRNNTVKAMKAAQLK